MKKTILFIFCFVIFIPTYKSTGQEVVSNPLLSETDERFKRLKRLLKPGVKDTSLCEEHRDGKYDQYGSFVGYGVYGMVGTARYPYGITYNFKTRESVEGEIKVSDVKTSFFYEKTGNANTMRQVTISSFPPTEKTISEWRGDVETSQEILTAVYNQDGQAAGDVTDYAKISIIRAFEPHFPTCKVGIWPHEITLDEKSDQLDGLYKNLVIQVTIENGFWLATYYLQDKSKDDLKGWKISQVKYSYDPVVGLASYHVVGEGYEEIYFNSNLEK